MAGCLAIVGPVILYRSGELEGSLGELMWLVGGLLVWIFDFEGVLQVLADPAVGDTAFRQGDGAHDAGGVTGGLEVRDGGSELVVDERDGLGTECVLGRNGVQFMAAGSELGGEPGCALNLDGLECDL